MRGTLPALGFCQTSQPLLRISYEVFLITAKAKGPHTAGEKLIKPKAVKMAQIVLGRNEAKRIDSFSMSDDTVNNRVADIANDILSQFIALIQDSPCKMSLRFDETTDIESISQLVEYMRFVKENTIVDEFYFVKKELELKTALILLMHFFVKIQ